MNDNQCCVMKLEFQLGHVNLSSHCDWILRHEAGCTEVHAMTADAWAGAPGNHIGWIYFSVQMSSKLSSEVMIRGSMAMILRQRFRHRCGGSPHLRQDPRKLKAKPQGVANCLLWPRWCYLLSMLQRYKLRRRIITCKFLRSLRNGVDLQRYSTNFVKQFFGEAWDRAPSILQTLPRVTFFFFLDWNVILNVSGSIPPYIIFYGLYPLSKEALARLSVGDGIYVQHTSLHTSYYLDRNRDCQLTYIWALPVQRNSFNTLVSSSTGI